MEPQVSRDKGDYLKRKSETRKGIHDTCETNWYVVVKMCWMMFLPSCCRERAKKDK
jgi:hypothetical protein